MGSAGIMDLLPADDEASVLPILEIIWLYPDYEKIHMPQNRCSLFTTMFPDRRKYRERSVSASTGVSSQQFLSCQSKRTARFLLSQCPCTPSSVLQTWISSEENAVAYDLLLRVVLKVPRTA